MKEPKFDHIQLVLTPGKEQKINGLRTEHSQLKEQIKSLEARKKQLEKMVHTDWLKGEFTEIVSSIGQSLVTFPTFPVEWFDKDSLEAQDNKTFLLYQRFRIQTKLTIK